MAGPFQADKGLRRGNRKRPCDETPRGLLASSPCEAFDARRKRDIVKSMSENLSPTRKRLLYRANHRGFKEADLVFGHFAASRLADMTDAEEAEFSRLLDVPDQDLYAWVVGRAPAPENYRGPVLEQLKAFDVSAVINGS